MGKNHQNEETLVNLKFEKLDQMVKEYNSFGKDVCVAKQFCYFWECVDYVSQLEQEGVIIKTKGKEYNISYLEDIMVNDGPEYALVMVSLILMTKQPHMKWGCALEEDRY